jgi:hypothetical protein
MIQSENQNKKYSFKKYSLDRFSVNRNLDFLINEKPQFRGQKEIITKGLSAYILYGSRKISRRAMKIEIFNQIVKSEKAFKADSSRRDIFTDVMGRVGYLEPSFFEQAYYPIGGMKALSRAGSVADLKKEILSSKTKIDKFVQLMRIYHFWHENLRGDNLYFNPSMYKCIPMLSKKRMLKSNRMKASSKDRKDLGFYKNRAALIYAASTIIIEENSSLINCIKTHTLTYKKLKPVLELWVARARYFSEAILSNVADLPHRKNVEKSQLHNINLRKIPTVECSAFECTPPFSNEDKERLRIGFIATRPGPKRGASSKHPSD